MIFSFFEKIFMLEMNTPQSTMIQENKALALKFNDVAKKYPLKALFVKVNTEAHQNMGSRFNIRSIPTLVVYKDGREKKRVSGAFDPLRLSNLVNESL